MLEVLYIYNGDSSIIPMQESLSNLIYKMKTDSPKKNSCIVSQINKKKDEGKFSLLAAMIL